MVTAERSLRALFKNESWMFCAGLPSIADLLVCLAPRGGGNLRTALFTIRREPVKRQKEIRRNALTRRRNRGSMPLASYTTDDDGPCPRGCPTRQKQHSG